MKSVYKKNREVKFDQVKYNNKQKALYVAFRIMHLSSIVFL